MDNDTAGDDRVTVASPAKLPVLFSGSRDALRLPAGDFSTTAAAPDDGEKSSAIVIVVLSLVVLAAIFFTVCGLLAKSQALVKTASESRMRGRFGSVMSSSMHL